MKFIKNFKLFTESQGGSPEPITKPAPTKPGVDPGTRPKRPNIIPTERPSVDPNPLASDDDVITRMSKVYDELSTEEKKEVDSYFE